MVSNTSATFSLLWSDFGLSLELEAWKLKDLLRYSVNDVTYGNKFYIPILNIDLNGWGTLKFSQWLVYFIQLVAYVVPSEPMKRWWQVLNYSAIPILSVYLGSPMTRLMCFVTWWLPLVGDAPKTFCAPNQADNDVSKRTFTKQMWIMPSRAKKHSTAIWTSSIIHPLVDNRFISGSGDTESHVCRCESFTTAMWWRRWLRFKQLVFGLLKATRKSQSTQLKLIRRCYTWWRRKMSPRRRPLQLPLFCG